MVDPLIPAALQTSVFSSEAIGQLLRGSLVSRLLAKTSLVFFWNSESELAGPDEVRRWKRCIGPEVFTDVGSRERLQALHVCF